MSQTEIDLYSEPRNKKEQKELEKRVNEAIGNLVIWLGSKKEYEEYVGHEVEFVSAELFMGTKQPILTYPFIGDLRSKQTILKVGIEALVQAKPNSDYTVYRTRFYDGIPVRRKISKIDRNEIES